MQRVHKILTVAALVFGGVFPFAVPVAAQNGNREAVANPGAVIYVKAGRVNYAQGDVTRQADGTNRIHAVISRDNIEARDVVRTGKVGKLELLLTPGSYLRADSGSEFVLPALAFDNLSVRLLRGRFVFEVSGGDEDISTLPIDTPQGKVQVLRRGIYRLNVTPEATQLYVFKGRAVLNSGALVKEGRTVTLNGLTETVAKFNKKEVNDGLDGWSRERGEMLVKLNRRISNRDLTSAFNNSGFIPQHYSRWGVWYYDASFGSYGFLPSGFYYGWRSPYGGYNSYWNTYGYYRYYNGQPRDTAPTGAMNNPTPNPPRNAPERAVGPPMRVDNSVKYGGFSNPENIDRSPGRPVFNDRPIGAPAERIPSAPTSPPPAPVAPQAPERSIGTPGRMKEPKN